MITTATVLGLAEIALNIKSWIDNTEKVYARDNLSHVDPYYKTIQFPFAPSISQMKAWLDVIEPATKEMQESVPLPTTIPMAELMIQLGYNYLKQHAPELLAADKHIVPMTIGGETIMSAPGEPITTIGDVRRVATSLARDVDQLRKEALQANELMRTSSAREAASEEELKQARAQLEIWAKEREEYVDPQGRRWTFQTAHAVAAINESWRESNRQLSRWNDEAHKKIVELENELVRLRAPQQQAVAP